MSSGLSLGDLRTHRGIICLLGRAPLRPMSLDLAAREFPQHSRHDPRRPASCSAARRCVSPVPSVSDMDRTTNMDGIEHEEGAPGKPDRKGSGTPVFLDRRLERPTTPLRSLQREASAYRQAGGEAVAKRGKKSELIDKCQDQWMSARFGARGAAPGGSVSYRAEEFFRL
jgi:hypothetical protein